jgi:gluconate 2-dehydrogenase gamma chain
MTDDDRRILSRRDVLRRVGAAGAAAVTTPALAHAGQTPRPGGAAVPAAGATPPPSASLVREAFENLTAAEADVLEAIVERLVPTDAIGPGAREARVAHYIDRALGGALAGSRSAYAAGLDALNQYAATSRGTPFVELSGAEQDAVLSACEAGEVAGLPGGSAAFFGLLLAHTRQGMFSDPYYGGNANYVGWDLLGYPGVRTVVSAADQKALEAGTLKPVRRSVYDYAEFNKAAARARSADGGDHHGD